MYYYVPANIWVLWDALVLHLQSAECGPLWAVQDFIRAFQQGLDPEQANQGLVKGRPDWIGQRGNASRWVPEGIRHPVKATVPPHQRTCIPKRSKTPGRTHRPFFRVKYQLHKRMICAPKDLHIPGREGSLVGPHACHMHDKAPAKGKAEIALRTSVGNKRSAWVPPA